MLCPIGVKMTHQLIISCTDMHNIKNNFGKCILSTIQTDLQYFLVGGEGQGWGEDPE